MDRINEICKKYEENRKKHYFSSWLNCSALLERIFYLPKREHPNYQKTRRTDFTFDQKFSSSIFKENPPKNIELKKWIFILKNHSSRITNRIKFLLVYVAFTGVISSILHLFNMENFALLALSVGLLLTIIERSMLIDKQSTIEELINLLEYEESKESGER
ncbi:hypothetical protein HTZ97_10440 [Desulfuromonas acetoxidans]|uniref:Uncharacterized protein n=1 Tax=Desulfuromonas acetoxidans (strain DSM 684 / 11070) TaxID=281689 RepID=Q1JZY2_DESA6|nr:hypothetical protein [Desulfuromonas acetoxidans]EAT15760.1 hypothetical protein Dace_2460 [Desulfuromonas acetoxidans DSM 684]MBF0646037.1 hypothetical protein [Desulfuromonas acetoxidans]NVD25852.1 hypothetical protein [Desulfuromonas acetoxidans]NVE16884.1 hypothetical protein [Desulfuromonas acetoxidans]